MNKNLVINVWLAFLLIATINNGVCQNISWSNQIGSYSRDWGTGITTKNGDYFILGNFAGPFCYLSTDTLFNEGQNSIFFVKYDKSGNEIWSKHLGGDNSSHWADQQGGIISYDSIHDFILIGGVFWGTAVFGSFQLVAQGSDIFIAKYDLNGNCIWAKNFGGPGYEDCSAVTADKSGNVFICGAADEEVHFDSITVQRGGYIAKFDSNGNCSWAKHEVNYEPYFHSMLRPMDIKIIGDDNIIVEGCLSADGILIIDTISIYHPGLYSIMICCFDGSGNVKWVREGLSNATETNSKIGLDSSENIYYTGYFVDSISFNNIRLYSNKGNSDMFVVKYDKNGNVNWAKSAGATSAEGSSVVSDPKGHIYVIGYFNGLASFDGFNITSYSGCDMFLARYTTDGICMGVTQIGNAGYYMGWGVSQDNMGNPYCVVGFWDTISTGTQTFISHGYTDLLLFKCAAITSIEEKSIPQNPQLIIYANPNTGKCNIKIPEDFRNEKNLTLKIFDNNGKMIQNDTVFLDQDKVSVNISAEAKGIYTAVLTNGKKSYTGKIIFQ
jgi:hypothetical protein